MICKVYGPDGVSNINSVREDRTSRVLVYHLVLNWLDRSPLVLNWLKEI
eukprot:UN00163